MKSSVFSCQKSNPCLLKVKTQILLFLTFLFFTLTASAQDPVILQEMVAVDEIPGHVDVKFQVVKCANSDVNEVFMYFHNESERYGQAEDATSTFDVVILDYQNQVSFTQTITITITAGQILTADCDTDNAYKIDLPAACDPTSIAAYITNIQEN